MIQALHDPDGKIAAIVERLTANFRAHCIYLFGSRARGDYTPASDYDIYMEVAPENWPENEDHTQNGVLCGFRDAQVHVRVPGWLASHKDEPGLIMYDVARDGILLHSAPDFVPVIPSDPPRAVRGTRKRRNPLLNEWMRMARVDYALVEHLSHDIPRWKEPVCFHAQQSAEKFLKALLVSRGKAPPHTHDLRFLLDFVRVVDFSLGGIDRHCGKLTRYAATRDYPFEDLPAFPALLTISAEEARRAIDHAKAIRDAVERELKPDLVAE